MVEVPPRAGWSWSISAAIAWHVRRRPEARALVDGSNVVTYRQLDERVSAFASFFIEQGVSQGDRIGIVAENRVDVVTSVLASARIGAVTVPTNWRLAAPELEFIARHAGLVGILTQSKFASVCETVADATSVRFLVDLDDELDEGRWNACSTIIEARLGQVVDDVPAAADGLQRIMYTSGTTSLPKGVMISHANVIWNCHCHMLEIDLGPTDVVMLAAPLFHVGGLDAGTLATLYAGGTVVFAPQLTADAVTATIEAEQVTSLGFVPAQIVTELLRVGSAGRDLSSLRMLISGGNTPEQIARFRSTYPTVRFAHGYGMTELSSGCSYSDFDIQTDDARLMTVGRPFPFMDVRVLADDDRELPAGEIGELVWIGPKVCLGYWSDPEATASLFTHDGWLRSGDYGWVDESGYVFFVDRKKDMLKSGGENVASAEVESALLRHEAVLEAAVVGVPDDKWGEVPKAFIVRRPGHEPEPAELQAHVATLLAKFKVPKHVEFVDLLPRNETGKILKRELRQRPT